MYNKHLLDYSEAVMSIPLVRFTDELMGIWYEVYVDFWLKMYYFPSFLVGAEHTYTLE